MKQRLAIMAALGWGLALVWPAASTITITTTYTFEGLTQGSDLATPISQDNWKQQGVAGGTDIQVVAPGGTGNPSANAVTFGGAACQDTRLNNGAFTFPALPAAAPFSLQFDVSGGAISADIASAYLGFGRDVNTSGQLEYNGTELALEFGLAGELTGQSMLRVFRQVGGTVDQSVGVSAVDPAYVFGDWVRLRLDVDPTANGDNGSGSLFYENLSDNWTAFQPVPGLQNLDLFWLTGSPPLPATWNGVAIDLRSGTLADNLTTVYDEIVPEPGVVSLLALGGLLVWRRQRK